MAKSPVTADVVERIKKLVGMDEFGPGTRLPAERELSVRLGVSRASIREALKILAGGGMLETRRGAGSQIARSSADVLRTSFEFLVLMDQPTIDEIYETRELIEVHLAERAALRRTEDDLAALRAALADLKDTLHDPQAVVDADVRFHETLARASGMGILDRFMGCLHDAIRSGIAATQAGDRDPQNSYEIHKRIVDAIERRDPVDARRLMTAHMAMALEDIQRGRG